MSIIHLALVTYGLCFLAADAHIFGVDATLYRSLIEDYHDGRERARAHGILPFRWWVLRWRLIREHLSCYFCMGVLWAGPLAHYILYQLNRFGMPWRVDGYFLDHPDTGWGWFLGWVLSALLGGACAYILNVLVAAFED